MSPVQAVPDVHDGLEVAAVVRRGRFELAIEVTVAAGASLAVLGANGSGKSTLLHVIAGLVAVDDGHITWAGTTFDDGAGTFRLPERRPIGYVFQTPRLFPHLTVLDNVAFGLRGRGTAKVAARKRAAAELAALELEAYGNLYPDALSGGQAQRVALARTLVTEPRVALLDEPFTAIDVTARPAVRTYAMTRLAECGATTLLVTHDVDEAEAVTDQALELVDGRVARVGAPRPPR